MAISSIVLFAILSRFTINGLSQVCEWGDIFVVKIKC